MYEVYHRQVWGVSRSASWRSRACPCTSLGGDTAHW